MVFSEARFPVEVKHEFTSIAPEHIRASFLAQSDTYAAATDHVAFPMILDLRERNAAKHRNRRRIAEEGRSTAETTGLYHLNDNFHMSTCLPIPDIPQVTPKVMIIGLVPGNRPLPSSCRFRAVVLIVPDGGTTGSYRPENARFRDDSRRCKQGDASGNAAALFSRLAINVPSLALVSDL